MIPFKKHQLKNGLHVLVNEDDTTQMAVFNLLYDVGARDDYAQKTGFAHLFEHLMFGGSENIESFDQPLHLAGGNSNAFTTNNITNYYDKLPAANIETAFWLESDRMKGLAFSQQALDTEKSVVSEEFKENYINKPYGDAWHHLSDLSYTQHPYKYPIIGKNLEHIEAFELNDVKQFFKSHYLPNRAVLAIAGGVKAEAMFELAEKWFGDIPADTSHKRKIPKEPVQKEMRTKSVSANVPVDAIYMAFHTVERLHPDFYATDILNDLLAGGDSSRLHQKLVKEQQLFSQISANISSDFDTGLFYITGRLLKNTSMQQAEDAIFEQLDRLINEPIPTDELEKVKNKVESAYEFADVSLTNRAFYLSYYQLLGDANKINTEIQCYSQLSAKDVQEVAKHLFRRSNANILYYHSDAKTVATA